MKLQNNFKYTLLLFVVFFCSSQDIFSQDFLPKMPELQTSVYDQAKLMSPQESKSLENKLIKYFDSTSTQIVVLTIKSLEGQEIAMYATELAHKWGIGQKGKDNGILILVSKNDRKVTIRTGYGVEHLLTDAWSKRIISNIITPEFKRNNYYGGLDMGTSAIIQIMSGEYQNKSGPVRSKKDIPVGLIIVVFIVIMMILSRKNKGGKGRNGGRRSGGFSILDAIILSHAGRGFGSGGFGSSSGSGGGFGGGGFGGGFGGGGFGGGGASGGW